MIRKESKTPQCSAKQAGQKFLQREMKKTMIFSFFEHYRNCGPISKYHQSYPPEERKKSKIFKHNTLMQYILNKTKLLNFAA